MTGFTGFARERADATILVFPARRKMATVGRRYALLRLISTWIERARQRQALADLDDRLLRDIGMTRRQAMGEFNKPFWR
jgi:uncharacterized protein YjiS (DUF1127 family)